MFLAALDSTGDTRLDVATWAKGYPVANISILENLALYGKAEHISDVNEATRFWAATTAIKQLGHDRLKTLERFGICAREYVLPNRNVMYFMGLKPNDYARARSVVQTIDLDKQAYRSNFEDPHIRESDEE